LNSGNIPEINIYNPDDNNTSWKRVIIVILENDNTFTHDTTPENAHAIYRAIAITASINVSLAVFLI
jgi:hypothetical protein